MAWLEPWGVAWLDNVDGVRLTTPDGMLDVCWTRVLGPSRGDASQPRWTPALACVVAADDCLTLLGATRARVAGKRVFESPQIDHVDLALSADAKHTEPVLRQAVPNIEANVDAPQHPVRWSVRLQPNAGGTPGTVAGGATGLADAALQNAGPADTILAATASGTLVALNLDGSTRWSCDAGAALNDVVADDLVGDGRDEIVLACQDFKVRVLDGQGQPLWQRELSYYRRPPYVNLVRTGDLNGDGRPEVVAGGENWRFYAFQGDGTELWNYESVHPSRAGAVADLDGDGKAEVICGTHYYWASVLSGDGVLRWQYRFGPICYDVKAGHFAGDRTRGLVFGSGDGKSTLFVRGRQTATGLRHG